MTLARFHQGVPPVSRMRKGNCSILQNHKGSSPFIGFALIQPVAGYVILRKGWYWAY